MAKRKRLTPSQEMSKMTPRELLAGFTYAAVVATALNRKGRRDGEVMHVAPAKGPRGLKRRAKKARLKAHRARLTRVTWCVYGEAAKKESPNA